MISQKNPIYVYFPFAQDMKQYLCLADETEEDLEGTEFEQVFQLEDVDEESSSDSSDEDTSGEGAQDAEKDTSSSSKKKKSKKKSKGKNKKPRKSKKKTPTKKAPKAKAKGKPKGKAAKGKEPQQVDKLHCFVQCSMYQGIFLCRVKVSGFRVWALEGVEGFIRVYIVGHIVRVSDHRDYSLRELYFMGL